MHRHYSIALVMFTASFPAFAEVSDKMPSIPQLWLQGGVLAALLFGFGRLRLWTAGLAIILACFLAVGSYDMVNDEHVGRAIRVEQGMPYVAAAYGSAALCLFAAAAAAIGAVRSRRSPTRTARKGE